MNNKIQFVKKNSVGNPTRAIICIHGWKGNKYSMKTLTDFVKLDNTTWYFIEAPYMVDNNPNQRSWSFEISPGVWEVNKTKQQLDDFFYNEIFKKFSSKDIYVIGFSQGALICYDYVLLFNKPMGGIFPIAGFFRDYKTEMTRIHSNQLQTPIIIGHGKRDEIINIKISQNIYNILKQQGANVELIEYNGGHKISIQYLKKIETVIHEKSS